MTKIRKGIPLIDQHDKNGYWGKFGGNFIPETLKKPVEDLTKLFEKLRKDKKFLKERLFIVNNCHQIYFHINNFCYVDQLKVCLFLTSS